VAAVAVVVEGIGIIIIEIVPTIIVIITVTIIIHSISGDFGAIDDEAVF
jgi:hypothetical protein